MNDIVNCAAVAGGCRVIDKIGSTAFCKNNFRTIVIVINGTTICCSITFKIVSTAQSNHCCPLGIQRTTTTGTTRIVTFKSAIDNINRATCATTIGNNRTALITRIVFKNGIGNGGITCT